MKLPRQLLRARFSQSLLASSLLLTLASPSYTQGSPDCTPLPPGVTFPPPITFPASFCGGSFESYPTDWPQVDLAWPMALTDVSTTNIFQSGVPFYVEGTDLDKLLPKCEQEIRPVYEQIVVEDAMTYSWSMNPPEATIGKLVGADENGGGVADVVSPAVVFRPNPDLSPGDYEVWVTVECDDDPLVSRFDDPKEWGPVLTWKISFTVDPGCTAELTELEPPTTPLPNSNPITIVAGDCCGTSSYFSPSTPIQLVDSKIPGVVTTGRYTVLDVEHSDNDDLVVLCEDLPQGPHCQDSGQVGSFGPFAAEDALNYSWTCIQPSGNEDALPVAGASERAVIMFTQEFGDHELCVTVRDSGQGPDSAERIVQTVRASQFPLAIVGDGPMNDGAQLLNSGCDSIRLYVNDDDDGAFTPPVPDNSHAMAIPTEDDMYHVVVNSAIQLGANQSLDIRFRQLGDMTFRLFAQPDHTQLWDLLPNGGWVPLPPAGADVWLEGLRANAAVNGSQLAVDIRVVTAGAGGGTVQYTTLVDATVFGITEVAFNTTSDATVNGFGHAKLWNGSDVPEQERPDNLRSEANAYFMEPEPRIPTDTKVGGNWDANHRHEVRTTITVQPAAPGVTVYVRSLDVDDNSLEEAENNFADDTPGTALDANDNYGLVSPDPPAIGPPQQPTRQGVVRLAQPGSSASYLITAETGPTALPAPLGQVQVYLRTTFAMGDNFRVYATLAQPGAAAGTPGDLDSNVMAPGPTLSAVPDYKTSPLAYRRPNLAPGMGYLAIPAGSSVGGSQGVSSHALTIRRVMYVEEEMVNGVGEFEGAFEFLERGMKRKIGRITPYPPAPAVATHSKIGSIFAAAPDAYKKYDWMLAQDESPNLSSTHLTVPAAAELAMPPNVEIPAAVFPLPAAEDKMFLGSLAGGRLVLLDAVRTEFPIEANGSIDVLSPYDSGNPVEIPAQVIRNGLPIHQAFVTAMDPNDATVNTTRLDLTAPIPGLLNGNTLIRISGVEITLDIITPANPAQTSVYLSIPNWQFPCVLYGEDDEWAVPLASELDLEGVTGGGPYNLVNHYLRNMPVRVEKLPFDYSLTWPFGPTSGAAGPQKLAFIGMFGIYSKAFFTDAVYNEERLWITHSFNTNEMEPLLTPAGGLPLAAADGDADRDVESIPADPATPEFSASRVAQVAAAKTTFHHFPVQDTNYTWVQSVPESCREHYKQLYPGVNWAVPNFAGRGANHRDVFRARVFAHELLHQLVRPTPGASYPLRGAGVVNEFTATQRMDFHLIPGISNPEDGWSLDFASNTWVQSGSKFNLAGAPGPQPAEESDVSAYMIWYARSTILFPYKRK